MAGNQTKPRIARQKERIMSVKKEKEAQEKTVATPVAISKKMIRWFERSFKSVFPNTGFIPPRDGGKAIEVVYLKNAEASSLAITSFKAVFCAVTGLKSERLVFTEIDATPKPAPALTPEPSTAAPTAAPAPAEKK
jgi:hypothetical protein